MQAGAGARSGARPVVADALNPDAVAQAVALAEPEVIVHELTALSGRMSIRDARHPERFSGAIMTNRLRSEGTDNLLAAGRDVGARRFVAQSFAAFRFAREGGPVLSEADPPDPNPPTARPVVRRPQAELLAVLPFSSDRLRAKRAATCAFARRVGAVRLVASVSIAPKAHETPDAGYWAAPLITRCPKCPGG